MKILRTELFKKPRDLTEFVNKDSTVEVVSITSYQIEERISNTETIVKIRPRYRLFYYLNDN